ncbi:MAG: hypothetical protein AABW67_06395 [Nanoarchaeota archaeon]
MRILFRKGEQRKFLELVKTKLNCVSIRGILQFGSKVSYDCLKNYYDERRSIPEEFFNDLCYLAKLDSGKLKIKFVEDNWGQVKGGKSKNGLTKN